MTTIILDVPDELAAQFRITPGALPALIREAVAAKALRPVPTDEGHESVEPLYEELISFLTSGPTAAQLLGFKISILAQAHLEVLLHKNSNGDLTPEERAELNTYLRLSEYLTKLKARVRAGQPLMG